MTKRGAKEILTDAVMKGQVVIDCGVYEDNEDEIKEALLIAIVGLTDNE